MVHAFGCCFDHESYHTVCLQQHLLPHSSSVLYPTCCLRLSVLHSLHPWEKSCLGYANSLLYGTSTANLHKLQCAQNSFLSFITSTACHCFHD